MFEKLKIGDTVTRILGERIPMELQVTGLTNARIQCGPWEFDRETWAEIDEELGWGPELTGSRLLPHD